MKSENTERLKKMTKEEAESAIAEHLFRALCLTDAFQLQREIVSSDIPRQVITAAKGRGSMLINWACLVYPVK